MKKILALLLAASFLVAPFNLYADDNDGETPPPPPPPQPPKIFIPKPNPDGGEINPCSLSPISGQCANGEIEIIFGADFGTVSITAVNNTTGDMWYCTGESSDGLVVLPIDPLSGSYTVTIETQTAGIFVGEFYL